MGSSKFLLYVCYVHEKYSPSAVRVILSAGRLLLIIRDVLVGLSVQVYSPLKFIVNSLLTISVLGTVFI